MPRVFVRRLGKYVTFPEGMSTDDMERAIRDYLRESEQEPDGGGIGPALKRGFYQGVSEIPAVLGGGAGLLEDILPGKQQGIEDIEQRLKAAAERTRLRGGPGESRGIVENVAETLATFPGSIASMIPAIAAGGAIATGLAASAPVTVPATLAGIGGTALGFGLHGAMRAGGEGLGPSVIGGLRGAAEGAAFGGVGRLAQIPSSVLKRKLIHAGGAGAIGATGATLAGAPGEDVAAHAAALGILGLTGKPEYIGKIRAQREVANILSGIEKGKRPKREYTDETKPPDFPVNIPRVHEAPAVQDVAYRMVMDNEGLFSYTKRTFQERAARAQELIDEGLDVTKFDDMFRSAKIPIERLPDYVDAIRTIAAGIHERYVLAVRDLNKEIAGGASEGVIRAKRELAVELDAEGIKARALAHGMQVPIAQALAQHRRTIGSSSPRMKALLRIKDDDLYHQVVEAEASGNFKLADKLLNVAAEPKLRDKVYEVWVNGLLTSLTTHAVNSVSNKAAQAFVLAERAVAPAVEAGIRGAQKIAGVKVKPRERYFSEFFADAMAWGPGLAKGVSEAARALRDDSYMFNRGKVEYSPAIRGKIGKIVRFPGRMLAAEDALFRTMATERELAVLSVRKALKEGKRGADAGKRVAEIKAEMGERVIGKGGKEEILHEDILTAAKEAGHYQVFTSELGPFGKSIMRMRNLAPYNVGGYIMPFVRTPLNIMKFGLERTLLGGLTLGKARRAGTGEFADAASRMAVGTAFVAMLKSMIDEDKITGSGPPDYNEQQMLRQTGWQPHSIKIGDQYFSYQRIEPIATILGMAADIFGWKQTPSEEKVDYLLSAVKENISNKTFLVGIEQLAQAWADPDRFMSSYGKQLMGSFVPAIVGKMQQAEDPYYRYIKFAPMDEPETILNPALARIPGLSEELPIKYGSTGQPLERPGSPAERMLSPFQRSAVRPESDVEQELFRLRGEEGLPPSMPRRKKTITVRGQRQPVELTDEEYAVYHYYHGQARQRMQNMVMRPGWDRMPQERRAQILKEIYDKYRKQANDRVNQMVRMRLTNEQR